MANLDKILVAVVVLLLIAYFHQQGGFGSYSSDHFFSSSTIVPTVPYYPPWQPENHPQNSPWLWLEPRKPPLNENASEGERVERENDHFYAEEQTQNSDVPRDYRPLMMEDYRQFQLQQKLGGEMVVVYLYEDE